MTFGVNLSVVPAISHPWENLGKAPAFPEFWKMSSTHAGSLSGMWSFTFSSWWCFFIDSVVWDLDLFVHPLFFTFSLNLIEVTSRDIFQAVQEFQASWTEVLFWRRDDGEVFPLGILVETR